MAARVLVSVRCRREELPKPLPCQTSSVWLSVPGALRKTLPHRPSCRGVVRCRAALLVFHVCLSIICTSEYLPI